MNNWKKVILKVSNTMSNALEVLETEGLGIIMVADNHNKLLGTVTDGDIRRKLLKVQKPLSSFFIDDALEHSIRTPTTVKQDVLLRDAVLLMEQKQVWDLPVIDGENRLVGLLHLHPAIQSLLGLE